MFPELPDKCTPDVPLFSLTRSIQGTGEAIFMFAVKTLFVALNIGVTYSAKLS